MYLPDELVVDKEYFCRQLHEILVKLDFMRDEKLHYFFEYEIFELKTMVERLNNKIDNFKGDL